jgi:uncharacterized protein YhdP
MPIQSSRIKTLIIITIILSLLTTAGYLLLPRLLDLDTYREQILAELQNSLHRPVSYTSGRFTFSYGPAISFSNVIIKEPEGDATFVTIEQLTCRIALLPLLKKHVIIKGLQAYKPLFLVERRQDGRFNFSDLLEQKEETAPPLTIRQVGIKSGTLQFRDLRITPNGLTSRVESLDLHLSNLARGAKGELKLSGKFTGGGSGSFAISGKARLTAKDKPLTDSHLDLKITTHQLDLSHFWPYYSSYVPFKKILGSLEADTTFNGRLREFTSSGKVAFSGLRFDYQPVFRSALTPRSLQFKYSMELTPRDVLVKALELALDGVNIKGSCAIRDIDTKDPRITAQAITSTFDFEKYHQYIPYGIIVKDTADWIEQHIKGGIYRLDDGRLDGRVSQILHMEKGQNYNVLYIKGRVEKGLISYGATVPTFNTIKGVLEMKGKDFFLHQMSGSFGTAPFTLEGRITDYPLNAPSAYPFKMTMSPGHDELAWLLGKTRGSRLYYNGNASLTLSGEGFTSGYTLTGAWNLTPAAYSYTNVVTKPVGMPSALNFRLALTPKEANVTSLQYTLGPMALGLTANYPFATGSRLGVLVNSNLFSITDVAPLIPAINKYQPTGRIQLAVRGETREAGSDDFTWRGSLAMVGASFKPFETGKPVSAITGTISFDEATMESTQLTARIGNTTVSGKGAITSFKPLAVSTVFTAPRIDPADFGFTTGKPVQISRISGDISFKDNGLQIRSLSGQVNGSTLQLKGTVSDVDNPKVDLAVTSPSLNIADILAITELEKKQQPGDKGTSPLTLKATVRADSGTFRDIPFEKLSTTVQLANRIVYLYPLEAVIFGGKLAAKGRIDTLSSPARYQAEFKLANASAGQILQYLSVDKKELTGTMTIEGELTARGETADELKRSALGSVKIAAHKGSMRQFSGLSKVFSILNVSQLFKLKLPDMVSEGMPYNDIRATLAVKDGVVSTNDLFVTSNAMNMSLIGKHDFIRDNMELTLGIQPLQTVDKVVSHIPIVGWILTGKDKSLITTYFEIKGKSANPQVSAVPVKYLGRGVLDIFKRVFQLPAKLVTDTGEVVLGN